jgi:hypothetical protein
VAAQLAASQEGLSSVSKSKNQLFIECGKVMVNLCCIILVDGENRLVINILMQQVAVAEY